MSFKENADNTMNWLKAEFSHIHTGRATPDFFDSVTVEAYGSSQPLKNMSSISVEDAKTLRIDVWDAGLVGAIEKRIKELNLGISTIVDGKGMRAIFPQLTEENRQKLVKMIKDKTEEAKIRIRQEREKAMNEVKDLGLGEDDAKNKKDAIQKEVEEANKKLQELLDAKSKELTEIS